MKYLDSRVRRCACPRRWDDIEDYKRRREIGRLTKFCPTVPNPLPPPIYNNNNNNMLCYSTLPVLYIYMKSHKSISLRQHNRYDPMLAEHSIFSARVFLIHTIYCYCIYSPTSIIYIYFIDLHLVLFSS